MASSPSSLVQRGPEQLARSTAAAPARAASASRPACAARCTRMISQADPRVGEPLAEHRIGRRARSRRASSAIASQLVLERRAAGRASTRPARTRACPSRPASRRSTSPTTWSRRRARAVEEHLVELGRAGELHDRADLDPGLVHRHEQVREALVLRREPGSVRASTKHQSAQCASDVHTFCPVITHSSPSSSARGRHVGQVGPGVRLGVALAPQLLAARDRRAGTGAAAPACRSAISVGPSRPSPMWPTRPGPPARAYSS